jgi:hypothetical protein
MRGEFVFLVLGDQTFDVELTQFTNCAGLAFTLNGFRVQAEADYLTQLGAASWEIVS